MNHKAKRSVKPSCHTRFQSAFTAWVSVFKVTSLKMQMHAANVHWKHVWQQTLRNIWPVCWTCFSTDDWHPQLSTTSSPTRCTALPSFSWSCPNDRQNPSSNCCSPTSPCSTTRPRKCRAIAWNLFADDSSGFCWRNNVCKSSSKASLRLWWVLKPRKKSFNREVR